jgi:hypothetical protein
MTRYRGAYHDDAFLVDVVVCDRCDAEYTVRDADKEHSCTVPGCPGLLKPTGEIRPVGGPS